LTEGLAGEARCNDINQSCIDWSGSPVKLSDVHMPDGKGRQESVALALQKHLAAVFVPLNGADTSPTEQHGSKQPSGATSEKTKFELFLLVKQDFSFSEK
jgi:hypothetical protein